MARFFIPWFLFVLALLGLSPMGCGSSPSPTQPGNPPANTPTFTYSVTTTSSDTPSPSATKTPTDTPSSTPFPSSSPTPVNTSTNTPTLTPQNTATPSPTDSPTASPTSTASFSPTSTATTSATTTPTSTPTLTPTNSATDSPSSTSTLTPTDSATATASNTPTVTPSSTPTSSPTQSPTQSPTNSPTETPTNSPTASPTSTPTKTPTVTPTCTTAWFFGAENPSCGASDSVGPNNTRLFAYQTSVSLSVVAYRIEGYFLLSVSEPLDIRFAVYDAGGNLVVESAPVSISSASGTFQFYYANIPNTSLAAGNYWIAAMVRNQNGDFGATIEKGPSTFCAGSAGSWFDVPWGPFPGTISTTPSGTYTMAVDYCQ